MCSNFKAVHFKIQNISTVVIQNVVRQLFRPTEGKPLRFEMRVPTKPELPDVLPNIYSLTGEIQQEYILYPQISGFKQNLAVCVMC